MKKFLLSVLLAIFSAHYCYASPLPNHLRRFEVDGEWFVVIDTPYDGAATLPIEKAEIVTVKAEKYDRLVLFNEKGAEYNRATKLRQAQAQECPTAFAVDPKSIVVRSSTSQEPLEAIFYEAGKDYRVEEKWGCIGRLPEGRIGENQPVFIDYTFGKMRIDSIVKKGKEFLVKKGVSHVTTPKPPELGPGEHRIGNVWVKPWIENLTDDLLFPILEDMPPTIIKDEYPGKKHKISAATPPKRGPSVAEKLIPKTMAKLDAGETVDILAWGDSVTDAGYLPNPNADRWQEQFVRRLRAEYPKAEIVLTTEAWGGRNSNTYRNEPPGSSKNYKEKVLDRKPDLIVMEFVNDAGMHGEYLDKRYGEILADFKAAGIEWIILTPHYVRGDWMGLMSEKNIDDDPRPYVKSVREFCAKNNIALADASKRYGRLWRQGIPYSTLMMNNINHPNPFGMSLFADALMELFP